MQKIVRFVQESIQELRLSSWLSRSQMVGSTIVVLLFSVFMALYVALVDRTLLFFTKLFFGFR